MDNDTGSIELIVEGTSPQRLEFISLDSALAHMVSLLCPEDHDEVAATLPLAIAGVVARAYRGRTWALGYDDDTRLTWMSDND